MNKKENMTIFNRAVVGDNRKSVNLFISKGVGVTNSIAKTDGKASYIQVPAIRYEDAIKKASVVKIDVEGAEYGYNIIQPHLRAIILEFHPIVGKNWQKAAFEIMNKIEASGFKPIMKPQFKHGWDVSGSWVR